MAFESFSDELREYLTACNQGPFAHYLLRSPQSGIDVINLIHDISLNRRGGENNEDEEYWLNRMINETLDMCRSNKVIESLQPQTDALSIIRDIVEEEGDR